MRQRDTTDISGPLQQLNDALFQLQDIHDDSQLEGYTVDQIAYENAQQQAQQALIDLMAAGDAIVDTTDEFTTEGGTTIALPNPPLERGADGLPQFPGGGG